MISFSFQWSKDSPWAYVTMKASIAFIFTNDGGPLKWTDKRINDFEAGYKEAVERIWNHRNYFWNGNIYFASKKDVYTDESGNKTRRLWIPQLEITVVKAGTPSDFIMYVTRSGDRDLTAKGFVHEEDVKNPEPGSGRANGDLTENVLRISNGRVAAHEFGHLLGIMHPGQYLPADERPEVNSAADYAADINGLMGKGTYLRNGYFTRWMTALNERYPNYGPYITYWAKHPDGVRYLDIDRSK